MCQVCWLVSSSSASFFFIFISYYFPHSRKKKQQKKTTPKCGNFGLQKNAGEEDISTGILQEELPESRPAAKTPPSPASLSPATSQSSSGTRRSCRVLRRRRTQMRRSSTEVTHLHNLPRCASRHATPL